MSRLVRLQSGIGGASGCNFHVEALQTFSIINIIPRRKQMQFEPELFRSFECLLRNSTGAASNVFEESTVRFLQTKQVIPAVRGRTEHHLIAGARQDFGGFEQQCCRQSRTVRIEYNSAAM